MKNLNTFYVVWVVDGPVMMTDLQYTDEEMAAVKNWTPDHFVEQAKDVEEIEQDAAYELVAIFSGNIEFVY